MLNFRSGKFGDALRNCEKAKGKYKEVGDHRGVAMAGCTAGMVRTGKGGVEPGRMGISRSATDGGSGKNATRVFPNDAE